VLHRLRHLALSRDDFLGEIGVHPDNKNLVKNPIQNVKCAYCQLDVSEENAGYVGHISYTPSLQAISTSTNLHKKKKKEDKKSWWERKIELEDLRQRYVKREEAKKNEVDPEEEKNKLKELEEKIKKMFEGEGEGEGEEAYFEDSEEEDYLFLEDELEVDDGIEVEKKTVTESGTKVRFICGCKVKIV
jgi:hypothetical protein